MYEWPAGRGDASEKLISTKLFVWLTFRLHRVVGIFNKSCLQLDLAHLRVTLTGSARRVKVGVKIGRWAITRE